MDNQFNTPWVIHQDDKLRVFDAQDQIVLMGSANLVAHIVLCVNAHQGLVDALQSISDMCDEDSHARDYASRETEIRGTARAAIAGVEVKK